MAKIAGISKEEAVRRLGDVPEDKRFWCHDGKVMRNLLELEEALKDMSEETFQYHLREGKNDFSIWIRDVVGDEKLAGDLKKAKSRAQSSKAVAQRVSFLRSKV